MKILVSAFEHSANVHLKALVKEFKDDVELVGVFDPALGDPIVDLRALAIMGIVDALKKLPFFLGLSKQMLSLVPEVDKVLLIDSSGFNLPLAKKIKKQYPDKEIIYYILPQAWAWKKKRIPVLARTIDHLASILPFEPTYYPKSAPIEYVGHPLLDEIPKLKEQRSVGNRIAFMPGSRKSEIEHLMPHYIALQKALQCDATLIVPEHFKERIDELYGDVSAFTIAYDPHKTLYESDFAFICSGTATLEAVLIGTPFVLGYIARKVDFFIGTRLLNIEYIGLGNIMFDQFEHRPMHPELWQNEVTVKNLLRAYHDMDQEKFFEDALHLRNYLKHGSSKRVAQIIEGRDED
jgi:lipid-A-disaccharide synthase